MKHCILILIIIILSVCKGFSQSSWAGKRDSMLVVLAASKEDTNKVKLLLAIGMHYDANNPDSAIYYYRQLGVLSNRLDYIRGKVTSLNMEAGILCKQNKADEAIILDVKALEIVKKANNLKLLGRSYINLAIPYKVKGDLQTALDYYLKASAIAEQLQDSLTMASVAINLSTLYKSLKEYPKAAAISLRGVALSRMLNNPQLVNAALIKLSSVLIEQAKYDTAILVLQQSKLLSEQLNDKSSALFSLINMGVIYLQTNRIDSMKSNAEELLSLSRPMGNKEGVSNALMELYSYYFYHKEYKKAKQYAVETLQYCKDNQLVDLIGPAYHQLSLIGLLEGDFTSFQRYSDLSDSSDQAGKSQEILKNTQELDAKYSLTQKQSQIEALNREKKIQDLTIRQRNIINWILAAAVFILAAIGFLFYRNQQQKRKLLLANAALQQQRITELEKERQLLAADAVLQGQEEERSRLAQDLHDGLGGILSSAKHSFNNMKNNFIITAESAAAFDKSMAMLDKSISELRIISHNMMPEALVKFGLDTALKDYCNSINQSGAIVLTYQSFDMDEDSIASTHASVIYRIVQELINNILKHAHAATVLLQLIRKNDTLSITVEDDGRGFEKDQLQVNDGIGLRNLQNRVAYLKGTVDITTAAGKGVSVNIEIPTIAS